MTDHYFGGAWTEIKLDVLEKYLNFYTTALKHQHFNLIYIDAFAGTGERQQTIPAAPLLEEEERKETLDGSAKKALSTRVPFDVYYFIENNKKRLNRLKEVVLDYPEREVIFSSNDANEDIIKFCKKINWKDHRAVMFLDPYGLDVNWETLEKIQSTNAIDVWFLFSLSGFYRQASKKRNSIEKYKVDKMNKILGTDDWLKRMYENKSASHQFDMYDDEITDTERTASVKDFENYVKDRLNSLFAYVSSPLALPPKGKGAQQFSLFLCVSNPKAISLAKKVSDHILNMYN